MNNPYISALYTYPVKSCAGIRLERAELVERGPRYDRQWMLVDADNRFLTQREFPRMALVQTAITDDSLMLTAPDMPPLHVPLAEGEGQIREVVVWRDSCQAVDAGDEVARWFTEVLRAEVRLVRMRDDFDRLTSTDYTDIPGTVGFTDGYPLLFISEASLEDLNERLAARGKAPVTMNRFRPNVVVADCEPYAEDTWVQVSIGGVRFDVVKPCARCAITTVDQARGIVPDVKEPLATLATYRLGKNNGAMFGQNVLHRACGVLRVGDAITVQG